MILPSGPVISLLELADHSLASTATRSTVVSATDTSSTLALSVSKYPADAIPVPSGVIPIVVYPSDNFVAVAAIPVFTSSTLALSVSKYPADAIPVPSGVIPIVVYPSYNFVAVATVPVFTSVSVDVSSSTCVALAKLLLAYTSVTSNAHASTWPLITPNASVFTALASSGDTIVSYCSMATAISPCSSLLTVVKYCD